jgi:hypothetical protein
MLDDDSRLRCKEFGLGMMNNEHEIQIPKDNTRCWERESERAKTRV